MNRLGLIILLLEAFYGFFSPSINAQVNLKSGYNVSFLSTPGLDKVISDYNTIRNYSSSFKELNWMHGFELGVRFKNNSHAIEITYQGGYQVLNAKGNDPGGTETFQDKMRFAVQSGAVGYQLTGERGGIGADFQYQWYNSKVNLAHEEEDFKNTQSMMAVKLYLMLIFPGESGVDLALQPYVVLPSKSYDLTSISQYLQQEASHAEDKWVRWGLSLLFYNGRKE